VDTKNRYYRIDEAGIGLLKFLIESYEGVAVIRTISTVDSVIEIMIAPGFEAEVEAVIDELRDEFQITDIERPEGLEPL
jgi:hypothetical protein